VKRLKLEERLRRAYAHAGKYALRDPRTTEQMAMRMRWERLRRIIQRRYE